MSTASRGRYFEHKVRDDLRAHGFYVIRSAASKGNVDLVALGAGETTLLVQVKAGTSAGLAPAPWNDLYDLAAATGSIPVLAQVLPRKPVEYWRLTGRKETRGPQPYERFQLGAVA
jgi:Holliday junction resolvase